MSPLSYPNPDPNQPNDLSEAIQKQLEEGKLPEDPIPATLIGIKVVVFNHIHGSLLYGHGRYFGIPTGIRKPKSHIFTRPLELSLFEAYYLLQQNAIIIKSDISDTTITQEEFFAFACKNYPRFAEKYIIYEDLRTKNYIPRPGQKFGADFIVYRRGPGIDHSSFAIQVLSTHTKISSIDVVRSARLAGSVKKRFLLANPQTKSYFSFKWFKP
ncbi:MAG: tRNA-intron lyase [Promethearchaeota archaeon]